MECALVRGRVAEEADADLIRLAQLYGQSRAAANLCSPLNLPLHCQMTLRYFEVEFQTFEPK